MIDPDGRFPTLMGMDPTGRAGPEVQRVSLKVMNVVVDVAQAATVLVPGGGLVMQLGMMALNAAVDGLQGQSKSSLGSDFENASAPEPPGMRIGITSRIRVKDPESRRVPNPNGKKGSAAHQLEVLRQGEKMQDRGLAVSFEHKVSTPNGKLKSRMVDVVGKDKKGDVVEMHQVGRQKRMDTRYRARRRQWMISKELPAFARNSTPTTRRNSSEPPGEPLPLHG